MKFTNALLLGLFMVFSFSLNAQKNEEECRKFRSLAGEEIKMKNYKSAIEMYMKAYNFCDACDAAAGNDIVYDNLEYAFEQLWKKARKAKDVETMKALGDSLQWVYEDRIEKCGKVSDKWNADYGSFMYKSKRDYEKGATLLGAYINKRKEKAGLSKINDYYNAVYKTYAKTKLNSWRDTLINKYFFLNDLLDILEEGPNAKYVPQVRKSIENILMERILKDCAEITKVLETKMGQFADMTRADKLEFCSKAIDLLDKKKCVDEPVYAKIIEVYIEVLPDSLKSEGSYKYAKYLEAKKEYKKALEYYNKAINNNDIAENNDKYKAGKARCMFRLGSYKACFSLAKSVNGKYRGESLKIAAQCIAQTANSCGVSTIERKANYYLAMDYLEKAKAAGAGVSSLMNSYTRNAPTTEEKFKEGWKTGQSVTLSCWGEATKVR